MGNPLSNRTSSSLRQMTTLEVLADPVRLRIVRRLAEDAPASLPQLAEAAGVHRNTLRPHIEQLEQAGLIVRAEAEPAGRGRPPIRYRLDEGWTPPTSSLQGLAELLAAAITRMQPQPDELRRLGEDWGRFVLGRADAGDLERELPRALERLGFQARVEEEAVELSACPCPLVAPGRPELVCDLTAAVIAGLLAGAGSQLRITVREHDQTRRSCRLRIERSERESQVGEGLPVGSAI
jgi:predicted ArsR family transcriptional regulator